MRASILLGLACCCAFPVHAVDAGMAASATTVSIPLDAATLAALPRETVDADSHGHALACEGVPLVALLRKSGAMPDGELRGVQLARFVEADARDGYRVVFSLGELDPATGARRVFVVDRCDGKPLGDDVGPLRLLVPDDGRPARWLRQLESITVSTP
ncbi:molybdopterin-binding protein [Pseudoluteimonas lycopersici]|uniref:Molybdopterin-binding protein n=1 Tax=Pseudoluteimonas lycopersici TaxID=1324796 RepID=A0A516V529_9GAMM|nr:molybdopterin-binding protein [Lysobacter lycopersici]QDQ73640.1 molybdopterin-binding protein [Lysobacter lycopersici]